MLFFSKGYLDKNEDKALAAVAKLNNQEKLMDAVTNTTSQRVHSAAVQRLDDDHLLKYIGLEKDIEKAQAAISRLTDQAKLLQAARSDLSVDVVKALCKQMDEAHLVDYIRHEQKGTTMRSNATKFLKNQEELVAIINGDYGPYEKGAAINNLDAQHVDEAVLKDIAIKAENPALFLSPEDGKAAAEKITDQNALLEIALQAKSSAVASIAGRKLTDRECIKRYLKETTSTSVFDDLVKKVELTDEEREDLAQHARLKGDAIMKSLFSEGDVFERCVSRRDASLVKTAYANIWDIDKLNQLRDICADDPVRNEIDLRIKTIQHMDMLRQKGFPAEINAETIAYNSTLKAEMGLLSTVKSTVEKQGRKIGFDAIYERSGEDLNKAVMASAGLSLYYFLGGPMMALLVLIGPSHWLSENARAAVWMVVASLQLADSEPVLSRLSPSMSDEQARELIRDLLRTWYSAN